MRQAPKVRPPKTVRRKFWRSRPITPKEFATLLRATTKEHEDQAAQWRRFLRLLWLSGLRLGEAHRLSWDTPPIIVDLDGGSYPRLVIWAEAQKSRSDEIVPITPDLTAWLAKTPPDERTGRVAPLKHPDGRTVSAKWAGLHIAELGELAAIQTAEDKWASAHDLRRSFGTRWAAKVRPLTLQRLMRHKSIETTLRYYVDQSGEDIISDLWGKNVPLSVPLERIETEGGDSRTPKNPGENGN